MKKANNLIEILTKCRLWILQFESTHNRNIWYEIINGITVTEIGMRLQSVDENNMENNNIEIEYMETDDEFELNNSSDIEISIPKLALSKSADDINLSANAPNLSVMPSLDEKIENKYENKNIHMHKNEPKYLTLSEIIEHVTSPQIRRTQNQLVLILTYCLYSSRKFSYI